MPDRDVVWITLESVRWDHTSFADHERDTTPNLARLARRDDAFHSNNCYAHGIYTYSSTTSMLTGRGVSNHGGGLFFTPRFEADATVPGELSEQGYRTACISTNDLLSPQTGLDRGFDEFRHVNSDTVLSEVPYRDLARYALNLFRHAGGLTTDTDRHTTSYLTSALGERYLAESADGGDPLYLYAHYMDTHHVYCPPVAWRRHFEDDFETSLDEALAFALDLNENLFEEVAHGCEFTPEEWNDLEVLYDTALAYVDHMVGQVVETALERLDDPVVVVTADHGENFGERDLLGHRLTVNQALTNVPLVVVGLGDDVDPDAIVQHADVLEAIGDDIDADLTVPAGVDVREDTREYAVAHLSGRRTRENLDEMERHNPEFDRSRFHESDTTAILTPGMVYRRNDGGRELVEVTDDGREMEIEDEALLDRFDARYEEWIDAHGEPVDPTDEGRSLDEHTASRLRKMGYLVE